MTDFMTCGRNEAKAAYDAVVEENKQLKAKLTKYENPPTNEQDKQDFINNFWTPYGKKGNVKTTIKRWKALSKTKQKLAMDHVPKYVKATPDKQYRKNAEVYLNQECWNDELPEGARETVVRQKPTKEGLELEAGKERIREEARKLNQSMGINIRERLSKGSSENA